MVSVFKKLTAQVKCVGDLMLRAVGIHRRSKLEQMQKEEERQDLKGLLQVNQWQMKEGSRGRWAEGRGHERREQGCPGETAGNPPILLGTGTQGKESCQDQRWQDTGQGWSPVQQVKCTQEGEAGRGAGRAG